MADSAVSAPAPATTPKKSKAAAASKKPRTKPSHPPTSDMVNAAIKSLKERGGSSLQAIKKYISANYKVDAEKLAPFIRKYLKSAVASGTLTQPKGKGASGSFKLSVKGEPKATTGAAKPKVKKAVKPKPEKKPKAAGTPKKAKKLVAAKKVKTPSKAKKIAKPPTKKPKSPKPKKTAVKKTKTPKKAAPKKK